MNLASNDNIQSKSKEDSRDLQYQSNPNVTNNGTPDDTYAEDPMAVMQAKVVLLSNISRKNPEI